MRVTKTLIAIFIEKLCNWFSKKKAYKDIMQIEVPTICTSRKEKDDIILSTLEHLEHNIKINNYGR